MSASNGARATLHALALGAALACPLACARPGARAEMSRATPHVVRFAIEVGPAVTGPVFVQLNDEDPGVGWLRASRGGTRVFLQERCAIPDCGAEPVVCGAAIPFVQNIAGPGAARRVEFAWDGLISVVDSVARCETRRPAPPGEYVARFCYSREAEFPAGPDSTRAAPGRLLRPICVERTFTPEDTEVVLTI